jgi:hypothetical protein
MNDDDARIACASTARTAQSRRRYSWLPRATRCAAPPGALATPDGGRRRVYSARGRPSSTEKRGARHRLVKTKRTERAGGWGRWV